MLKKKLIRDIIFNKSQFVTIFLMVFLGVVIYSGITAYMDGMKYGADKYYEENNFQDIWVIGTNFTKENLEDVKKINNIKDAERKLTVIGSLDEILDSTIQINFIESNNISKFYVKEGEGFNKNVHGVWIDSYLADSNDLKVGDILHIRYDGETFEQKIVGLILVPDHVYSPKSEAEIFPTHTDYGFIYLSSNEFPYGKENIVYNYMLVDVQNTDIVDETKIDIEKALDNFIAVTDRRDDVSSQRYEAEREEGETYVGVFSGMFLFIAILSVITTMNRIVRKQRTEIGILKALGFKNRKIITLYISYGLWISIFAVILGIIIGPLTIGNLFLNMVMAYYEIPKLSVVITSNTYLVSALVVFVISVITYLSCRKELKEKTTNLLKMEELKLGTAKIDLNNGILKDASFSTRWNIRDILRSKARTIMGIGGIAGCCSLIICAFGILNTLNDYINWQFNDLSNFEYKITLKDNYSDKNFKSIVSSYGDNSSQTLHIEIKDEDTKQTNTIVVDNSNGLLRYTNKNRKFMKLEDTGIYVTTKLAEKLNLKIGDTITWHILGNNVWHTSEIIGFNRNPQSQNITMTKGYMESIGIPYKADAIYTNEDLSSIKELPDVDIIQNRDTIKAGMESMIETMKSMIILIIAAAIVLGIVIIYNLGSLSFTEKIYQFATLKVLGFRSKQIGKIFTKQNEWMTYMAIILGVPLGYYMVSFIFKMALSEDFDMMAKVELISYLYGIVGTFVVSLIVNKFLSKKVKTINMVESLKANE